MANQILLSWNPARSDETRMTLSPDFKKSDRVTKLDFLKDSIGLLESEYEKLLNKKG